MITPAQCRAARGLLEWSQSELAHQARVGIVTVHQLEAGISRPRNATLEVIRRAFESGGRGIHRRERRWPRCTFAKEAKAKRLSTAVRAKGWEKIQ